MGKGQGLGLLLARVGVVLVAIAGWYGCAHETTLTKDDIHLYSGLRPDAFQTATDSLVCVSYNIKFSKELDLARLDFAAHPYLNKPDILLLQEMEPEGVAFLAKRLGMNYFYYPSYIHYHHGKLFGNAVLSPWPLSNPQHLVLPHAILGSDNHRVALAVDVQVGDHSVRAISVHLATLAVSLNDRLNQAIAIRDSLVADKGPTVIGGDFNSYTDREEVLFRRVVRKAGFKEARISLDRTVNVGLLDMVGYKMNLDHFFYRDLNFVSAGGFTEARASDHFPVWSVFLWE